VLALRRGRELFRQRMDRVRLTVGAPLQAIFAVVTTLGIAYFWGLGPA
jgi:hypothetical protein